MSSRIDVVKSLLRSAAQSAGSQLVRIGMGGNSIRKKLSELAFRRLLLSDSRLTAAVARVPDVAAVTVSSAPGLLRIDASFHDGNSLLVTFTPQRSAFAPRGAKEFAMRAAPEEAALSPRCGDIFAAIATEVAHALWGPFLRLNTDAARSSTRRALSHRHGDVLVVDLRSVPAVRAAMAQPLTAAAIEALSLKAVEVTSGGLKLVPNIAGLDISDMAD
jgi:hypothetical protein